MYHLAQVNIAKMLAPIDDPIMADFVNNLEGIKRLEYANTQGETPFAFTFRAKFSVADYLDYKPLDK